MGASQLVRAYPITGRSEQVFPGPAAGENEYASWGYIGFTLANLSETTSYRVTFTSRAGEILDTLNLSPLETRSDWYGPQGITFASSMDVAFVPDTAENIVVGSVRVG